MAATPAIAAPQAAHPGTSDAAADGVLGNAAPADLFTTLLVAQIRNQNPLEPADPAQFVAQLTQLSQMEALNKLTTQGSAQGAMLQGLQAAALGVQVGSSVSVVSDRLVVGSDASLDGSFTLGSASAKTALLLTGAGGAVHRVELGRQAAGRVDFSLDPAALGLAPGRYALAVQNDANDSPAITLAGILNGVHLSATGSALLDVSSAGEVPADALAGFNGRPASH